MKYSFFTLASMALLPACSTIPPEAYSTRMGPEALLDVSLETVSVPLDAFEGVDELTNWINNEQPSRAELECAADGHICLNAERVLEQFGVPTSYTNSPGGNQVVLHYERILARDCDPKYVTNHVNPYNINHSSFGCSVSSNTINMVSDRRQFVNPALLDFSDATKPRQVYKSYTAPTSSGEGESEFQFSLEQ